MSGRRRNIVDDDMSDDDSGSDDSDDEIPFSQDRDQKFPDFFYQYFPGVSYDSEIEKLLRKIRKEHNFLLIGSLKPKLTRNTHAYFLDYANWPIWVKDRFKSDPDPILAAIGITIHWEEDLREDEFVRIRVMNYVKMSDIEDLSTKLANRFVRIKGTVLRTSDITPMVKSMVYVCLSCLRERRQTFSHGKIFPPQKCGCGVRNPKFHAIRHAIHDIFFQTIRIQGGDNVNLDSTPMDIQVELTDDLVGMAMPGEQVDIGGILRTMTLGEKFGGARSYGRKGGGFQTDTKMFMFMEANILLRQKDLESMVQRRHSLDNNVQPTTQQFQEIEEEEGEVDNPDSAFTLRELAGIRAISKEENVFQLIVHSLCPTIFGMEIVKAGLALSLFGGVKRVKHGTTSIRSDPHILLVGDPGLGKSQLLLSMSRVAPRGIYVCSKVTTTRGLTVAVLRDQKTGEYAMEAGALVLADQGTCCIDEFDKLQKDDFKALLEAMEQQTVSIAKAGIVCTIPTRCCVIAAANPVGGRYTRSKTVAENIRMMPAMLSRFDLVFVLLDTKDERRDDLLARYVVNMHSEKGRDIKNAQISVKWEDKSILDRSKKRQQQKSRMNDEDEDEDEDEEEEEEEEEEEKRRDSFEKDFYTIFQEDGRKKGAAADEMFDVGNASMKDTNNLRFKRLRASLSLEDPENFDPLPPKLLKTYVKYAKLYCQPTLSEGAKDVLKNFFMSLRKVHQNDDSTPITTRQLESLIRLGEARAKVELRKEVTVQDAWDVIEIMKESMYDLLVTDEGHLDFRRSAGTIKGKDENKFIRVLERRARRKRGNIFKKQEIANILREERIKPKGGLDAFIDRLNLQGFLLMAGGGKYRLTTVSLD